MDLKSYDINKLTTIWKTSTDKPELQKTIGLLLKEKSLSNQEYSKEYLFGLNQIEKRALEIFFIPGTESFKKYGSNVTVDLSLDDNEFEILLTNRNPNSVQNTYGQLKTKVLVKKELTEEQISELAKTGVNTNDILKVETK